MVYTLYNAALQKMQVFEAAASVRVLHYSQEV